jgi:molybdopterin converting factor small subunit
VAQIVWLNSFSVVLKVQTESWLYCPIEPVGLRCSASTPLLVEDNQNPWNMLDHPISFPNHFIFRPLKVTVELFGIPRLRAGVSQSVADGSTLGEILLDLGRRFPSLGESCIDGCTLKAGYIANLRGERFVSDPETELNEGDIVLLMSLDAGG